MNRKVLIIASYAESLINFRLHLIKEFLARGYAVTAIAPLDETVRMQLAQHGVKFISVSLSRNGRNPIKDLLTLIKLFLVINQEKPGFVFTYTIKPVIYGTLMAKLAGVANIYSMITGTGYIFSNADIKSRLIGFIAKKMFRYALRFNKKLFFQNHDNAAQFLEEKLINNKQAFVVIDGSGVDVDFFYNTSPPSEISFLMIARLILDKGVREYIEAARLVKIKYPHVVFRLAGAIDTNPNAITQQELSCWIESGVVEYLGKLADVREVIARSAVYVLPSYGEGTPRTVLEAMSMGRPVITTDVPGCKNTVVNGKNGFLVPAQNVASLYAAIEYFINNPEKISEMGYAGRQIAIEKYDVHKVNKNILAAMEIA